MWMNVVQTLIIAHRIVENTDGSFTCSCNDGYTTTDNGITCDGMILSTFWNDFANDMTFHN